MQSVPGLLATIVSLPLCIVIFLTLLGVCGAKVHKMEVSAACERRTVTSKLFILLPLTNFIFFYRFKFSYKFNVSS